MGRSTRRQHWLPQVAFCRSSAMVLLQFCSESRPILVETSRSSPGGVRCLSLRHHTIARRDCATLLRDCTTIRVQRRTAARPEGRRNSPEWRLEARDILVQGAGEAPIRLLHQRGATVAERLPSAVRTRTPTTAVPASNAVSHQLPLKGVFPTQPHAIEFDIDH